MPKEILRKNPLFSCLNETELTALASVAVKKTYPKNTILFNEGDKTDSIYIVYSGKVKVTIIDSHGKEIILSLLGPGEYFGEMAALIDDETRSASVMTRETSELLVISRNDFREILSTHPDIVFSLLKGSLERLREANKKIESLALMDVYGRIARLFMQFAQSSGETQIIEEKLTHQDIANMVGSSREMVSRVMKELTTGEYIEVNNKLIEIKKKLPYSW
ncbi:MAG: Crp/Fnr family transcriptional regulator [Proteobacteria bacterium]|nr:Crp/Fnr family transcriptional regulator [Pseudomonadota bacterium]MBU1711416.1 Crp/Fnr family transcriptional regulator [Pseudomonadota bacterium]